MKLSITLFIFLLVFILSNACSSSTNNSAAGTTEFPQGKELYLSKCTACHSAYKPELHTKDEWKKVLDIMGTKAKLTDNEKQIIMDYLTDPKHFSK